MKRFEKNQFPVTEEKHEKKRLILAIDIDGVICKEGDWGTIGAIQREPIQKNIDKINKLFDDGNYIVLYSARLEEDRAVTEMYMKIHKVKYNVLVLNKLVFDMYIDTKDKIMSIDDLQEGDYIPTFTIDTELCEDCGELLVKEAATAFVIVVQNSRLKSVKCSTCFQEMLMKKLKNLGGTVVDEIMEYLDPSEVI